MKDGPVPPISSESIIVSMQQWPMSSYEPRDKYIDYMINLSSFLSSWWIGNNVYSTICRFELVLEFRMLILV